MKKYFLEQKDSYQELNSPASDEQIIYLEKCLGVELPKDFRDFLKSSNGFEGLIGKWVVNFASVEQIFEHTRESCTVFFPWAIYIGTDGGSEMFVIDKRQTPFQFGLLPFVGEENDFLPLGDSFEKFLERLFRDDSFERL